MIKSLQNETLKRIRRLRRCKGDHALLEGPHLLREALTAGLQPELVLATPQMTQSPRYRDLFVQLDRPPREVAPEVLEKVMDADSPRGILAVVEIPRAGLDALPGSGADVEQELHVFADGLQDPGNLGALARVLEAAGGSALVLAPGCAHANHPRALRASAGSLLRMPVASGVTAEELDAHLRRSAEPASGTVTSPLWLALEPRDGVSLYSQEAPLTQRSLVLALGAEGPGLSGDLRRRADVRLTIPMAEPVESLNAVVAAALVLFEIGRRREKSP